MPIRVAICEDGIFRLTDEAILWCVEGGMTLAPALPEGEHRLAPGYDFFTWGERSDGQKYAAHHDYRNEFRTHPIVLGVIEELGDAAMVRRRGDPSRVKIVEIPFDSTEGWSITSAECSSSEYIVEDHRTWS